MAHFFTFFEIYKIFTLSHRSELKIKKKNHLFLRKSCEFSEILQNLLKFRKWTCSSSQLRNFSVRVPGRGRMVVVDWQGEVLKGQFSARKRALAPSEGVQALPGPAMNDHHTESWALEQRMVVFAVI